MSVEDWFEDMKSKGSGRDFWTNVLLELAFGLHRCEAHALSKHATQTWLAAQELKKTMEK